jgi:hypothetical protein
MRISEVAGVLVLGIGLGCSPALAFDGTRTPSTDQVSPVEAFRNGAEALRVGEKTKAVSALEYAAEKGHTLAAWKLGRMYADGDGVPQDDMRAFTYFNRIADQYFAGISSGHGDDNPEGPQSRFIANALVTLGHYYLEGIPNAVTPDPERAREMFSYAASYFGDPDAQYNLARLYLHGDAADPKLAIRWFGLAANKGQYEAQAMLGAMLFKGDQVPRQGALGLMWLTLARDAAPPKGANWVAQLYDSAFKQATDDERGLALRLLEDRLKHRRD